MPDSAKDLWAEALSLLTSQISRAEVARWLVPLKAEVLPEGRGLRLIAPNRFFVAWINERYLAQIKEAVCRAAAGPLEVSLACLDSPPGQPKAARPNIQPSSARTTLLANGLNPDYTFDNFVVGSCNQFAHAAARAVAEQPGKSYNPLFVYGGAGLGKTHLANAIGNHILRQDSRAKVIFISAEDFANQFIRSVRDKTMDDFRAFYRQSDVLIMDDVHFLGTKDRTQEELLFTFNALYDSGRQIVLTADLHPNNLPGLEERLRSRFAWGLLADLQMPDRQTKQAILIKKAEEEKVVLSEDLVAFLASFEETNIRLLEGYLIRLLAYSSLNKQPLSLELAQRVLKDLMAKREVSVEEIIRLVGLRYNVRLTDIRSSKKERRVSEARQIAMYLARKLTKTPLVQIGAKFGGKDHSTVVHAVKKISARLEEDLAFKEEIKQLEQAVLRQN